MNDVQDEKHEHLKIKLAVSGAADTSAFGEEALVMARELGREIVRQGATIVTGATTGFPLWAAMGAKDEGGISIGLSPAASEEEHRHQYKLPVDYMDVVIYTGAGYPGRDLLMTRTSDAVLIGCGRVGTIHEFTIAFEDKKPIGILEGSWPTDELIRRMVQESGRGADNPYIVYEKSPKLLVQKIIELVQRRRLDMTPVRRGVGII